MQAAGFLPAATLLLGPWAGRAPASLPTALPSLLWLRLPLAALGYGILQAIAEQVVSARFPETAGFFELGLADPQHWGWILGRGLLIVLACGPLALTLRGPWVVRGIVLSVALATLVGGVWAAPTALVPDGLRYPMWAMTAAVGAALGPLIAAAYVAGARRPSEEGGTTVAQFAVEARRQQTSEPSETPERPE